MNITEKYDNEISSILPLLVFLGIGIGTIYLVGKSKKTDTTKPVSFGIKG